MLEVFPDRVVVSSPGLPPTPITLQKLRAGKYRPCSRNPILAQRLSFFHSIEERGSGFRQTRNKMMDHGLEQPGLATDTGYFQVIFTGPGDNLKRLRVPARETGKTVPPSVEEQLNDRQKKMAALLVKGDELTSQKCEKLFAVTRDTATRDSARLIELAIAEKKGAGRATRYVFRRAK